MIVETLCGNMFKARADNSSGTSQNSTDATFPSKIPTATEPTGTGVIEMATPNSIITSNGIRVMPYGTGAENTTFSLRVIGWSKIDANPFDINKTLWIPVVLCELLCTLSTVVGVATKCIVATERFADTLAVTTGSTGVTLDAVSPTGNVAAHALVDTKGHRKIEITFTTGGSATDMNCLVAKL